MMRRRSRRRKDVTVKGVPPQLNPEHRVEPDGPFIEQRAYHRIGNLRPRHVRPRELMASFCPSSFACGCLFLRLCAWLVLLPTGMLLDQVPRGSEGGVKDLG